MSAVRFGAKCDACGVVHNGYSVGDIAGCDDCGRDLCDACASVTVPPHLIVREEDVDQSRARGEAHA